MVDLSLNRAALPQCDTMSEGLLPPGPAAAPEVGRKPRASPPISTRLHGERIVRWRESNEPADRANFRIATAGSDLLHGPEAVLNARQAVVAASFATPARLIASKLQVRSRKDLHQSSSERSA